MSTALQEKLADKIVKNAKRKKPLTRQKMLESVGYSTNVAKGKPKEIFDAKGVKDALVERGFSVENAKRVVGQILDSDYSKDSDRLRAADMIFEVHGAKAPVKTLNVNVDVAPSEAIKQLAHELIELQRSRPSGRSGAISEPVGGAEPNQE